MESIRLGTAALSDEVLVKEFESCRLPAANFHHADHIRLAWIFLGKMSEQQATERIVAAIRRFAAHNGISEKYHHTITLAWMRLVAAARRSTPEARDFKSFADRHAELFDVRALNQYYSSSRLLQADSKTVWVEPDVCLLP